MNSTIRNIIIFIVIFGIAVGAYMMFFANKNDTTTGAVSSQSGKITAGPANKIVIDQDLFAQLSTLQNVKLSNSTIFQKDAYTSLKDFTVDLGNADPQGRANPFAPSGATSGNAQTAAQVTTAPATNIGKSTVTLNGLLPDTTGATSFWFEWGRTEALAVTPTPSSTVAGTNGTWSYTLNSLFPGTTYYYRAAAKVGSTTLYGSKVMSFKTLP